MGMRFQGNVIDVRALQPGTKLHVETRNSTYDIIIVQDVEIMISGGRLHNGEVRFTEPTPASIVGATYASGLKMDRIVHGMGLAIDLAHGCIQTSPILEVNIESPDGSWSYSMDWRTGNTTSV